MGTISDAELEELLDKYEKGQKGKRDYRETALNEEEQFILDFGKLRAELIRPKLESLGRQIQARGHDFALSEGEFIRQRGSNPKPEEAFIKMTIYLAHESDRTQVGDPRRPYMTFSSEHRAKKVVCHISDHTATGGQTWKDGEYTLNQVTPIFIVERFVALFRNLAKK
jgi:hypothetical protein